jgi:L-alanine-DL-glutamate epimerase-like enolase superfamily enzyme
LRAFEFRFQVATMKATDIRIKSIQFGHEDFQYRTPIKFGGVAVDRATIVNVHCEVETASGKTGRGFGSMPLGNVWSFPSRVLTYDQTLAAMKALVERIAALTQDCKESGHPIDLTWALEPAYLQAAKEARAMLNLAEPIPHLCTLVAASPFDAALHDAFGKVHGLNCYETYGPDFMSHDLGHYLGREFQGEALDRFVLRQPKAKMPLYHLIGALDPLEESDIEEPVGDGLPETLPQWIHFNGLTHLKIKLNGDDLNWDIHRVVRIDHVAEAAQHERNVSQWYYSLDFNERCPSVDYLLEMLARVKERRPAGFERIQYIEQPTARDLKANRQNVMHRASQVRPVVIDESLIDLESLRLASDMGYTGAALKACKGQSQSLLLAAAAQKFGMFLCVQDLTCPGASLIHSAGLAAHVPGVAAIESNARQYVPIANQPWEERFPGIFHITDGAMNTGTLTGPGLGAVV